MLEGFRDKDFLDQITILNDIAGSKDQAALPGLVDLFENPINDTSIDYMVVNALNAVLSENTESVIQGLSSQNAGFKTLCIRVAGEYSFPDAVPQLIDMAEKESDPDGLLDILTALSRIGNEKALPVFRKNLDSSDPLLASLCIEAVGALKDTDSKDQLMEAVTSNEADDRYEQCDITCWKAIESLTAIGDEESLTFLAEKLHHRNPTARRIITDAMIAMGEKIVPYLAPLLESDNVDEQILAANVLGFIQAKDGGNLLVSAFDRNAFTNANVKYAVYEAMGRIGTMKCIICLMDGLAEEDELILMAVITGLEKHVNPGMIKALTKMMLEGGAHGELLSKTIVSSMAVTLFEKIFEDKEISVMLSKALGLSKDLEVVETFREKLTAMSGTQAKAALASLPKPETAQKKALAADDSRSMVALHRAVLSDLGFEPLVAANGQEAYDHVENGESFDLVITDMNMPVMDGMELVEKLRGTDGFEDVPIIMVTTESEASQQTLAAKSGVTAFITKPFKPDELKDKIRELTS